MKKFILKIFRGTPQKQYWEEFELELKPFYNIISALMDVQKSPYNKKGEKVEPVAWEQGCLEEVCGSCSMLINGRPRQACTALIEKLIEGSGSLVVTLAPMTKFTLVRDLVVKRDTMFNNLKKVHAWIDVDGSFERGFGPKMSPQLQEMRYTLSTCMTCGCCSEACPQVNEHSSFMGPAPISQVRLFNSHPTGKMQATERLHSLMEKEGVGCGNAQNCVEVCPKQIPLTESLADMGREVSKQAFRDLLGSLNPEEK